MYYCFVEEDFRALNGNKPLSLQIIYAKYLKKYLCINLKQKEVNDGCGKIINVDNMKIFLRTTYGFMRKAMQVLQEKGAVLIETIEDLETIENWNEYQLADRGVYTVTYEDIFQKNYSEVVKNMLRNSPNIFLKTKMKGFSAEIATKRLLTDAIVREFLKKEMHNPKEALMISEKLNVEKDSLGIREIRAFVMGKKVLNVSRPVHSIKHSIPLHWIEYVCNYVKKIAEVREFPPNYVLDIGEFEKEGKKFWDIVEINPVTCSLCYVNNSIFQYSDLHVELLHKKIGMGYEYCYDALENFDTYIMERNSIDFYGYISKERYIFS